MKKKSKETPTSSFGVSHIIAIIIILIGIIWRLDSLGHLPGVNGDEAFYGVKALQLLNGESITWVTGSGYPLPPFLTGMHFLSHIFVEPSFLAVRLPAVFINVLLIFFAYYLFRNDEDKDFGILFATLLASLPILIGYSRFSWEPSLSPFAVFFCMYFIMHSRLVPFFIVFFLSLFMHQTNVFAFPIYLELFLRSDKNNLFTIEDLKNYKAYLNKKNIIIITLSAIVLTGGLVGVLMLKKSLYMMILGAMKRSPQFKEISGFFVNFFNFFNGNTIFTYIAGPLSKGTNDIHYYPSLIIIFSVFGGLIYSFKIKKVKTLFYLTSFLLSTFIFYVIAGNRSISPYMERYAMWIAIPFVYLFLRALIKLSKVYFSNQIAKPIVFLISALLLLSFRINYFSRLKDENSVSHRTFFTGEKEPKSVLAKELTKMQNLNPSRDMVVYLEDWWIYYPFRYLTAKNQRMHSTIINTKWDEKYPKDFDITRDLASRSTRIYVAHNNGRVDQALKKDFKFKKILTIGGYKGKDLLNCYTTR